MDHLLPDRRYITHSMFIENTNVRSSRPSVLLMNLPHFVVLPMACSLPDRRFTTHSMFIENANIRVIHPSLAKSLAAIVSSRWTIQYDFGRVRTLYLNAARYGTEGSRKDTERNIICLNWPQLEYPVFEWGRDGVLVGRGLGFQAAGCLVWQGSDRDQISMRWKVASRVRWSCWQPNWECSDSLKKGARSHGYIKRPGKDATLFGQEDSVE
ncbi:hypothetical protein B0H19DRAFT_1066883 [Mycena capillaripes]|nr:hypothetical protein B0H19DRAFT_1066883 [Mycena capillaripes]